MRLTINGCCLCVAAMCVAAMFVSCTEDETMTLPQGPAEELVTVELPIELEDNADAASLYPDPVQTRSVPAEKQAVDVRLVPAAQTRAINDDLRNAKATALVHLHVMQLKTDGTHLKTTYSSTNLTLGGKILLDLVASDDCQLVIFARGGNDGEAGGAFSNTTWQKHTVSNARIKGITTAADMNKMPYLLHLKHVKVVRKTDGTEYGSIQSLEEKDVRLRLRRLAARLNVTWDYKVPGYRLTEVTLQDTPLNYLSIPSTTKKSYPDLVGQYTSYSLASGTLSNLGSYSGWMPRVVRGTSNITSAHRRGKQNAPEGSVYLRFIAVNEADANKKLTYRVYLGGNTTSDFNVLDNTNYNYELTFSHADEDIWKTDDRVDYESGASAIIDNNTPVPTSNCFMVEPGGSFNFDPFKYQRAGDDVGENTVLLGWAAARGGIKSVKLIWQTRENGDVGDPVMGAVNSSGDHSNIVAIQRTDGGGDIATNPATRVGQCRIYCKVAPNTVGGNGLIAAYDAKNGEILWSWHVWITKYNPDPHGKETVLTANKQKHVYSWRADLAPTLPMMDRFIGAQQGYEMAPEKAIDKSRGNGMHYEWGRKDPFPGSFTMDVSSTITIPSTVTSPVSGLQNLYEPDGYSFRQRVTKGNRVPIETASKNPHITYIVKPYWFDQAGSEIDIDLWTKSNKIKSFYDPCPAGWRVPDAAVYNHFFKKGVNVTANQTIGNTSVSSFASNKGGAEVKYDAEGHTTYFRYVGYQEEVTKFNFVGQKVNVWCSDRAKNGSQWLSTSLLLQSEVITSGGGASLTTSWHASDPHPVRCIQERE